MLPADLEVTDAAVVVARSDYDAAISAAASADTALALAQQDKAEKDQAVTVAAAKLNSAVDAAEADLETYRPGHVPPSPTSSDSVTT